MVLYINKRGANNNLSGCLVKLELVILLVKITPTRLFNYNAVQAAALIRKFYLKFYLGLKPATTPKLMFVVYFLPHLTN